MVLVRATRCLLSAGRGRQGADALLSDAPVPDVGPLGTWFANVVALPYPGRCLVLFTAADTLLSVVAPGRSLQTTTPVFQRRAPLLLLRLGLPGAWVQAQADSLASVHIARARVADRRVLGTMIDAAYQIRAEAEVAGSFDRLDLDQVEDRLADVPLSAIGYGRPAGAVATLAEP